MSGLELPETPAPLKSIQPFLKIATDHEQRDIVITYWCRLYALQTGLKLKKTSEETNFLLKLMDWLETTKKKNQENESITNEICAQAHLENWALKLFLFADKNDRASNYNKNVIQSFYTAGLLYDVLTTFGELSEEALLNRKYAKWKAAYIHNCLKNGQTPIPGPAKEDDDNSNENVVPSNENEDYDSFKENDDLLGPSVQPMQPMQPLQPMMPTVPPLPTIPPEVTPPTDMGAFKFPSVPNPQVSGGSPVPTMSNNSSKGSYEDKTGAGIQLTVEQSGKAHKYIKWAGSALDYDDVGTAVTNLKKALHLLTTGKDPV